MGVTCDDAVLGETIGVRLNPAGQVSNSLGGTTINGRPVCETGGSTCVFSHDDERHRECRTCKASRPYMDFYVGAKGNPCLDECRACVRARCEVFKAEYLREHGTPYVRKKERDAVRAVGVG